MIREFGLSIKFRWSGGGKKNEEKARPRPQMSRKQEKMAFRGLGRAENRKNWLSEASDEQKTVKIGFPRPRMSRKQKKMAFRGLGRVENSKNCISAAADE